MASNMFHVCKRKFTSICTRRESKNFEFYLFIGVSNFRYGEYLFVKKKRLAKKSITGSSVCKYVEKYECF
jgi:hypothetical protein